MKRIVYITVIMLLALVLSACNKKEENTMFTEILPTSQELYHYEGTENADVITVDENGLLYTATYIRIDKYPEQENESKSLSDYLFMQKFCVYNLEGECVQEKEIEISTGTMRTMTEEDGVLYCIVPEIVDHESVMVLYAIDVNTWEAAKLTELDEYSSVDLSVYRRKWFWLFGIFSDRRNTVRSRLEK